MGKWNLIFQFPITFKNVAINEQYIGREYTMNNLLTAVCLENTLIFE